MTTAATAPPYGYYIILKGVCSVALLCEWLQPLTKCYVPDKLILEE